MKPQTTKQILCCLTLGGYTARVVEGRLETEGPQPLAGPLPASIKARRAGLPHDYPGRDDDLQTMRKHHEQLEEIPPEMGFWAWWRRVVGGRR